jgi:hypothetical protein
MPDSIPSAQSIIAERILEIRKNGHNPIPVPVRILAPVKGDQDWSCRIEIDWPRRPKRMDIYGIDAFQALDLALRTVGAMLYTSVYHGRGELVWLEPGDGYGFPVGNPIRDMLVGDDKTFFR